MTGRRLRGHNNIFKEIKLVLEVLNIFFRGPKCMSGDPNIQIYTLRGPKYFLKDTKRVSRDPNIFKIHKRRLRGPKFFFKATKRVSGVPNMFSKAFERMSGVLEYLFNGPQCLLGVQIIFKII